MSDTFYYPKTMTKDNSFNKEKLWLEISNEIPDKLKNIVDTGSEIVLVFDSVISAEQEISLSQIVSNHETRTQYERLSEVIKGAKDYAEKLILEFGAQNMLMGITQAGKTKMVADYLSDILKYAQTGSLYEVINEIDRLNNNGHPQELSPFVTSERLNVFKQRIVEFLT